MKTKSEKRELYVALGLAALLLICATILHVWLAVRIPLWGDELDTLNPAFRPWRGDKNFWWQIGQFNACPPGEPGVLRIMYRRDFMPWLRELTPELYWRLPYIFSFLLTAPIAMAATFRVTKSTFASFLAFLWLAASTALLTYATETRYYAYLALFMTASISLFFIVSEKPWRFGKSFYALSIVTAAGVCFHLMLASIGYFLIGYTLAVCGLEWWRMYHARHTSIISDAFSARVAGRYLLRIFFGFLPFIMYKVALKHWVFIPPADPKADAWEKLLKLETADRMAYLATSGLAWNPFPDYGLYALIAAVAGLTAWKAKGRDFTRVSQGLLALMLLIAAPAKLFLSAAERNYGLQGRHFVFYAPVVLGALLFCYLCVREKLPRLVIPHKFWAAATICVMLWLTTKTLAGYSQFAYERRDSMTSKITYPFLDFKAFYKALPAKRRLVIVGTQPDTHNSMTDQGNFRAGIMKFYTKDFNPWFYSVKGTYDEKEDLAPELVKQIDSHVDKFDFLLMDSLDDLKRKFPKLPWGRWNCHHFQATNSQQLNFCRM